MSDWKFYFFDLKVSLMKRYHLWQVERAVRSANAEVSRAFGGDSGDYGLLSGISLDGVRLPVPVNTATGAISFAVFIFACVMVYSAVRPLEAHIPSGAVPLESLKVSTAQDKPATVPEPAIATVKQPIAPAVATPGKMALIVSKHNRMMYVVRDTGFDYEVLEKYEISFGKMGGDKVTAGDLRTPEGVYSIVETKEGSKLPKMYGPRAFVLNYPNELDRQAGKTGSGIWIHGTGAGARTPDTEGCVEIADWDIEKLTPYISNGMQVMIFPEDYTISSNSGHIAKADAGEDILTQIKLARLAGLTTQPDGSGNKTALR